MYGIPNQKTSNLRLPMSCTCRTQTHGGVNGRNQTQHHGAAHVRAATRLLEQTNERNYGRTSLLFTGPAPSANSASAATSATAPMKRRAETDVHARQMATTPVSSFAAGTTRVVGRFRLTPDVT